MVQSLPESRGAAVHTLYPRVPGQRLFFLNIKTSAHFAIIAMSENSEGKHSRWLDVLFLLMIVVSAIGLLYFLLQR